MGASSSVESSGIVKYVKPLAWEYEASKAVMEPAKARKNMLDYLTGGKIPFSENHISIIKDAYDSCNDGINALHTTFEQKWEAIIEDGGSQFRASKQSAGGSRVLMEGGGDPMSVGGGGPISFMGLGGAPEPGKEPEEEPEEQEDEHEAGLNVTAACHALMFTNQLLPECMERVCGGYQGVQIGLKMSARWRLLQRYEQERKELFEQCEELEVSSREAVETCLRELLVSQGEEEVSGEGGDDNTSIGTDITWGVSLQFLKDFLLAHPQIDDSTSTGSVVYDIIIPETADSKQTYVEAHLLGRQAQHLSDLREGYRRVAVPRTQRQQGVPPDKVGLHIYPNPDVLT